MTLTGKIRLVAGLMAAALFALMVILLQSRISGLSTPPFLPQGALLGYSATQLTQFNLVLTLSGQAGFYHLMLARVDPLFIGLFGLWIALSFPARPWLGVVCASVFVALDLTENMLLLQALFPNAGVTSDRWILYPPSPDEGGVFVSLVTQAKFAVAAIVLAAILVQEWRARR